MMRNVLYDHNLEFFRGALKRAAWEHFTSIMNENKVDEAFKARGIQMITDPTMVQAVTEAAITNEATMQPLAKLVANKAQNKLNEAT